MNKQYKVAKYMRLSREDGDDRESESIENQRDIIDNYITEREDLEMIEEYVDDGYTGTNFNRPGFKKMLEDIEAGKIDCIVTKDLSRFGRDHIDTGYYLERYFPANGLRYIAIGDNVDTIRPDGLQFLTFKLSFNDYYAQDISNKIKSVKFRKIEKGEFQGGIAPYGYKKDNKIKNHLIIDEYAADIVKDIFDMYVNKGKSPAKIADELNKREVLAPAVYLKIPTFMKKESSNIDGKYLWLRTQIGKILKNEVYIGNVVGRKSQKVSHKITKVKNMNPEDYIIVENMHEPIIDMETWNKAQEKIKNKHICRTRKFNHPLKGLIFCRECGGVETLRTRTEQRKSGKEWKMDYFICSNKNSYRGNCPSKQIRADYIENEIKKILIEKFKKFTYTREELTDIFKDSKIDTKKEIDKLEKELKRNNKELEIINRMLEEIYEDKVNKVIRQEDFEIFYNKKTKEKANIEAKIKEIEYSIKKQKEKLEKIDIDKILKEVKEILSLNNVSKEMYEKLIEKIEVDKDKKLYIKFKFSEYI